jgi:hypothetical protein
LCNAISMLMQQIPSVGPKRGQLRLSALKSCR